ncbi:MAG: hypothetical protein WCK90_04970 [archaeon]
MVIEKEDEAEAEENISENAIKEGNISLILDSYNDIFSSFDPRGFSERALSDDFLIECKHAARDQPIDLEGLELRLMVPRIRRNFNDEFKIKRRLKHHFQKHFLEKEREIGGVKRGGYLWFFSGAVILFILPFLEEKTNFIFRFITIMMEPASWFFFWEGLYKVFVTADEKKPDLEFYKKMAHAQITFLSY